MKLSNTINLDMIEPRDVINVLLDYELIEPDHTIANKCRIRKNFDIIVGGMLFNVVIGEVKWDDAYMQPYRISSDRYVFNCTATCILDMLNNLRGRLNDGTLFPNDYT